MMTKAVDRRFERRSKVRCIVEKSCGAGQDYVSVRKDIEQSHVLEVTADRATEAIDPPWRTLSQELRTKVKAVWRNTWEVCGANTKRHVRNIRTVPDRFHIAKYLAGESKEQLAA